MPRLLGLLLLLATLTGSMLLAQEQKQELTKEERARLAVEANRLNREGSKHYEAGEYPEAEKLFRQALRLCQNLYPQTLFPDGHPELATSLDNVAVMLQVQRHFVAAEPLCRQALEMRQKLYSTSRYPDGYPELAINLSNLATILLQREQLAESEMYYRQALAMYSKLYPTSRFPEGHPGLAAAFNNMSELSERQGKLVAAELYGRQAVAMYSKLYPPDRYPDGHPHLATSLNRLAGLVKDQGKLAQAEPFSREALRMRQKLYPPARFPDGHPELAGSLHDLAGLLTAQGQFAAAEKLYRDALAMNRRLYPPAHFPDGHSSLATTLNMLASLLQDQGKLAQAEPIYREALAMRYKLHPPARFPNGHPYLANCLNNLASVLRDQGQHAAAEKLFQDALAMRQKLYPPARFPNGHPSLATGLNNLAGLLRDRGQLAGAETLIRDALEMDRKLFPPARFPDGHPTLAKGLNNLASLLHDQGQLAAAEALFRDALAMRQKLYPLARYPNGNRDLASTLNNLASLNHEQGQFVEAELHYREALTMYRRLALAYAEERGEGEALTLLAEQPRTEHSYLSLLRGQPRLVTQGYGTLWTNRSFLTRLAEQKHLAVRAVSVSPKFRQQWEELVSLKRQRAQLLLASESRDPETVEARAKLLQEWGQKINDLSSRVREGLTALQELQQQDQSTPADLQKAMPKESIYVDLLRHKLLEFDPAQPGKTGRKWSLRYIAFLVTKDQICHIDLGPAEPLEAAVKQWRESITAKNAAADPKAPAALRRLLWEPLEKHFPPGTTTVYLCPDQLLCFLPWGALPGKKAETVLLEEYTLTIVPHGPYLLGQLLGTKEKETKKTDLLVLGGVKYDDAPVQATVAMADRGPDDPKAAPVQAAKGSWPYLKGTATEAETIRKLAEQRQLKTQLLSDRDAGTERFKQELPRARIAHLATHGFFADPKFRSVFQLDEKLFVMRGNERVGAGALLPSLLSGLVFAGANRPETPGRGIVTAEELFDLDLTSMELAVLSACETGLGDVGGGEGVFGLQRAFHVVGCQNVIASLRKVGDVPTLVLMEEFYRNLWEKKLSKREALRQAQLTVYRNPEMVLRRAKEMGVRGIEDEAVPLPAAGPTPTRRSPPAWWAAFLLSGLGE